MDESLRHFNPNPMLSANPLSKGLFWWLNPLFNKGRKRELEIDDMYNVCPQDSSEKLGADLEREWQKELKKKEESGGKTKPSLLKALVRLFGLRYMLLGIIVFFEEGVRVAQPLLLGGLIRYFTPNSTTTVTEAYMYALGVSLCAIMLAIAHHPYFFGVTRMGMQMRVACCSLMYKKALRLSNSAMGQTTVGQIVNLMSNDVNRFDQAVIFLHFLWIGPLQAIAVLVILWHELGPSVLAGFAVLLLLIPVQGSMGRLFSKLRRKTAVHTDERVKVMNEIIAGMRVIKMYCWEKPFGEIVEKIRSQEIVRIRNARFLQAFILAPNFFSVKLILLLTFVAFTLAQGAMTPWNVFITIGLYQAIRVPITVFMPFAVQNVSEISVSFDRVQHVLLLLPVVVSHFLIGRPLLPAALFQSFMLLSAVNHTVIGFVTLAIQYGSEGIPTLDRVEELRCFATQFLLEDKDDEILRAELLPKRHISYIRTSRFTLAILGASIYLLPILGVVVATGNPLHIDDLFLCFVLFNIIQQLLVFRLSIGITFLMDILVSLSRIKELRSLWRILKVESVRCFFYYSGDRVLVFPVLVSFILSDSVKTAYLIFLALNYTLVIHRSLVGIYLELLEDMSFLHVNLSRIKKFLLLDELEKTSLAVMRSELRPKPDDCGIKLENVTAKWNEELECNTLQDVSANVRAGELVAVIGPVGAGKSSLLMAVLGELPISAGKVEVKGKVAYVSQQAWVFSGSLRQNILFGQKYDKAKFDRVIKASAMHKDLEIMPHGDSTLIGDRGVSLSGGQRARLSLARALYSDADVFLLDDPLSAVDSAVGRHIFEKCIQGVLRSKPRILVTHQLQYLKDADTILILKEGQVAGSGTYKELSDSGIDFAELLKSEEEEEEEKAQLSPSGDHAPVYVQNYTSTVSLASAVSDFEPEPVQLPEEEERAKGRVGIKVYVEYFKAGAGCFKFFLLVFFNLVAQTTYIMSDWWLSRWSNSEEERVAAIAEHQQYLSMGYNETNVTIPYVDSHLNIYIFTGIIVGVFTFGMVRALLFFKVAVDASQKLHNTMFARILRSKISFFDTNPVGRILNRFSKDVGHMDDNLPITFFDFIQCFLQILGIVLVAGFVNPWVFIPTVPIIILFVWIRQYYLSTARSIKRLEGTTRSPVFSYLSASLQGLHTIRAFNMEQKCMDEFDAHQDLHSEAWFLFLSTSRWLAVRLDWLCAFFVTAVTFCCVFAADALDAGLVGLSITYSMMLMGLFQWGVRQSAEVENQMISVERVLEYSHLPTEAALESDEKKKPPKNWPEHGAIQADNVCLQYFPNAPIVLKNLTFRIKEKEKVGIVGRTGAGKSSLITGLFRLVEPTGCLQIDDVDIQSVGLHDLRKCISIIPQDPVLFTGTLRRNLDPFMNHGDEQLWKALAEVQLKEAIEELPAGLETSVSEGGVNFSVGQRQLICLARAILRHNRILLIDEATANVDPKTDEQIQETIREKFRECTVLTIAHRLHTIMDSDRVLVLSEGKIVEFEPPHLLLQRKSGMFYDMVQQVGKADAELLATIAADTYHSRYGSEDRPSPSKQERGRKSSKGGKKLEEARTTDEIVLLDKVRLSMDEPDNVGMNHVPRKMSASDEMNLSAPLAVAESFHSLLSYPRDFNEESEGSPSDSQENVPSSSVSKQQSTESLSVSKQGLPLNFTEAGGSVFPSAEAEGKTEPLTSTDETLTATHKSQLLKSSVPPHINIIPPTPEDMPAKNLEPENLKDTSLEDDVFETGGGLARTVSSMDENAAGSEDTLVGNMSQNRNTVDDDDDNKTSEKGSDALDNDGDDDNLEFDSNLLQRDESGIGTDVNGSSSDVDENTSATSASDRDALLPLSKQKQRDSAPVDLPNWGDVLSSASQDKEQFSMKTSEQKEEEEEEEDGMGASELDVLIVPSSDSESTTTNNVRS